MTRESLYLDKEKNIETRTEDLLKQMNLEEKIAQLGAVGPSNLLEDGKFSQEKAEQVLANGIGQITRVGGASGLEPKEAVEVANKIQDYLKNETRLGIPAIIHEECLSGYMGKGGTTYPQAIGLASSWEPDLIQKITNEIRKQLNFVGAHLALSPLADVGRDPRWGRIEETFGEDQYLVARMVASYVQGLEGEDLKDGIYATLKHFAAHGIPEGGRNHAPVNISSRKMWEDYLFPYQAVIEETNLNSIMNAYHTWDGVPCAASKHLLTDILRGDLGFDGIVISDYWSIDMLYTDHRIAANEQEAGIKALEAGLDIELPEVNCYGGRLENAVKEGLISESVIDQAVKRHLSLKFKQGIFDQKNSNNKKANEVFETEKQRNLAREAARKSMVLLKNEGDLLPVQDDLESIAVIGPSANNTRNLLGDYAYSAHVGQEEETINIVSVLDGIKNRCSEQTDINYALGCNIMGAKKDGFAEAVKKAENSEVAVVVVGGKSGLSGMGEDEGTDEEGVVDFADGSFATSLSGTTDTTGEHHDRTDLQLPGVQKELVKAIVETGTPVIAVLVNGRPLAINWLAENVPAILEAWLPGEEGGNAVAELLFGDYSPSGKLPVSIPKNVGQIPINYNRDPISINRDYVFEENKPLFPFGYGLSYTQFKYSNLEVTPYEVNSAGKVEIKVEVENIGEIAGEEIVQLYINDKLASLTRPNKELKGFKKVKLKPGKKKTITFVLAVEQLAFYDQDMNLIVEPGEFLVMIGSSSADIKVEDQFVITGDKKEVIKGKQYFTEVKTTS